MHEAHTTDQMIADLADGQHRLVTRQQLRESRITERMIYRRRKRGFLVPEHPGVFSLLRPAESVAEKAKAATLAIPGSAACRSTAVELHDLPDPRRSGLEITVLKGRTARLEGVTVHETRWLPAVDIVDADGTPTTSTARTVCDLAWSTGDKRLNWLTQTLLAHGRLDDSELVACALSFCRRGRHGSARLRRLLDDVATGEGVPASRLELAFVDFEAANDLPVFTRQFKPPWYDGIRGIVDFARIEERLIIEVDGRAWHMTRQAIADDKARDRAALRHGWLVLRFSWAEIVHRPDEVLEDIEFHLVNRALSAAA